MKAHELRRGIYWVGAVDWDLRTFHGYQTQRGSSYNAYLIIDKKVTLIDTVKSYLCPELLARIQTVIDPANIDYVVVNHVEMDHSGSLPLVLARAPRAVVLTSPNGEKGLRRHFDTRTWNMKVVSNGETLGIGERTLQFVLAPMVHWPDSMVTYVPQEQILFSNDAFGQHIASAERFDDELGIDIIMSEAAKYYANIVLPFGSQVQKLLGEAGSLVISTIAPSHGIIWRKHIADIVAAYGRWSQNECKRKALIVYDTMWGATKRMALALRDLFEARDIAYDMKCLSFDHISDVMTSLLEAKYVCVGSPTLNNEMLPTVAAFLTYMKGLAPQKRTGIAFGSYGWGGQSVAQIESVLEACKWAVPVKGLRIHYTPQDSDLAALKEKVAAVIG